MKRLTKLDLGATLGRLASFAAGRAWLVVLLASIVGLAAAYAASKLEPSAATDTLVNRGDASYRATQDYHRQFGDDPIVIMAQGKSGEPHALGAMVLTKDLGRLLGLEGCIAGNAPKRAKPAAPVCARFAKTKPIKVVYGPGTFINEAAGQISGQFEVEGQRRRAEANKAARAARRVAAARGLPPEEQDRLAENARQLVYLQFARDATRLALKYGLTSVPALNNPDFVLRLVFDAGLGQGVPKPRFSYVFPSSNAALIQARLRPGLSDAQKRRAIEMVRRATASKVFRLEHAHYIVSGVPVVSQGVEASLAAQLRVLLAVVVAVMAIALALVFRTSRRLLPLALALLTGALTFGLMSLIGTSLTIAAIAVLPILIGLAVDYAIQFQARFDEQRRDHGPREAAREASRLGGPAILVAATATAIGFCVLLLSPVPMVRSFGSMLVIGIVVAFWVVLWVGFAVLGGDLRVPLLRRFKRAGPVGAHRSSARDISPRNDNAPPPARDDGAPPAGDDAAPPARTRGKLHIISVIASIPRRIVRRLGRVGKWGLGQAFERPRRVLVIAVGLAVVGWIAGTQVEVVSDITRLVPANQQEVQDLRKLQDESGVSGDIDVVVRSDRLTKAKTLRWMADYQARVLGRHGYQEGRPCREAKICPALSLTNLFNASGNSPKQIRSLLDALPPYFSQAVISRDRKTAVMAFGIRTMPLSEQKQLVDDMRSQLDPPPGADVELAGLPVLAADANAALSSSRWIVTLAGIAAVLLVLLAAYRRVDRSLVPLVPVVLATGWAGLVLWVSGIPLNPMSATLGALVVAITTEFSVILSARYQAERRASLDPKAALERTFESTGKAVLASGVTVTVGFAALIASDFPMLRDFGLATVVDLGLALLGVMIVLPAALLLSEQRKPLEMPAGGAKSAEALGPKPG